MTSASPGSSSIPTLLERAGAGAAGGMGTGAGTDLEVLALVHRDIDARSVVTLIVFFAVSEYPVAAVEE